MSKGMQIQVSESDFFFFCFPFFFSFVPFSYKTTCTLSNQFRSVQTTKIPVLHYQILHIENSYKAQVKKITTPFFFVAIPQICVAVVLRFAPFALQTLFSGKFKAS